MWLHTQDHLKDKDGALEQTLTFWDHIRLWIRGYWGQGGSGGHSLKYSWQ